MENDSKTHYEGCFVYHYECWAFWMKKLNDFYENYDTKSIRNLLNKMVEEIDVLNGDTNSSY